MAEHVIFEGPVKIFRRFKAVRTGKQKALNAKWIQEWATIDGASATCFSESY